MKMQIDRMGVFVLMSHLVITLAVLVIYAVGSIQGHGDETLKTLLFVIMGYWFGAIGKDQLSKKKDNSNE
jgi:K+ transporter